MPNDDTLPEEEPKNNIIIDYINSVVVGFGRFLKSSYLSISFVIIILLLVQALEQANTLLVDMVESDKLSLALCFIVISFFAATLSHYPIYIYYSKDLNESKNDHLWYAYKSWLGYYIYIYRRIDKNYTQDFKAKFFRQTLGLVLFSIWHFYIYQAFYPKLITNLESTTATKYITIIMAAIPVILLMSLLHIFHYYQRKKELAITTNDKENVRKKRVKFTRAGAKTLVVMMLVVIVFSAFATIQLEFNYYGYWLLQIATFLIAVLYVLFRVFRVYVNFGFLKLYNIRSSVGYLRFYLGFTVVVILFLLYSNIAAYYDFGLLNAMLILLSWFYIIYYFLACGLKYAFVLSVMEKQKKFLKDSNSKYIDEDKYKGASNLLNSENEYNLKPLNSLRLFAIRRRRLASIGTIILIVVFAVSYMAEKRIHELEIHNSEDGLSTVSMTDFKAKILENKKNKQSLFFVAAHGGGLKANIWTMKVLNALQTKTEGSFLNSTVSLSGASGGMMGLSMYSVLSGKYPEDYRKIGMKIDEVADKNFASHDVALTFGYDFFRKFVPFHSLGAYRDRSYFAMVKYRNILEDTTSRTLDTKSFNTYWKDNVYNAHNGYFPSLIINTAKTNGKRGVFYSIDCRDEGKIFSNSDKLSQLNKGYIAFYEAVSSTNRFPALSPAAKIKGYGHYIDAGAIDNSGLLSSLDLYTYFQSDTLFNKQKKIFVEILNGKSSYIGYMVKKFNKVMIEKNPKYKPHFTIDEIEQDNIIADIKTGLNLDKIPNYLSDYLSTRSQVDSIIDYVPIYLPFHLKINDVESYLGGEIEDTIQRKELEIFLKNENKLLRRDLRETNGGWDTYEPTLARHLSKSTIEYYDRVLKGDIMKHQIYKILNLLQQ